jgi:hypothetical protein
MTTTRRVTQLGCAFFALGLAQASHPEAAHAQALETETARLLPAGGVLVGGNYEAQTSSEGREFAAPFAVEVGLHDRLELLAEPVPYTSIRPHQGAGATGAGDLEVTLTYLLRSADPRSLSLALAAEAKLPTARNALIGTRKTDFTGYLITSTTRGAWSTHANVGYAVLGRPTGVQLNNIFNFALAEEYQLRRSSRLFGEVLGSTPSGAGEGEAPADPSAPVVSELAGSELVGTLGIGHLFDSGLELSASLSYDNNQAVLLRTGFTFRVH